MKQFSSLFFFLFFSLILSATQTKENQISIYFEGVGCGAANELSLFQFNGINFQLIQKASSNGKEVIRNRQVDVFEFQIETSEPRFYYIGFSSKDIIPIILGTEDKVRISGRCQQMRSARISNSPLNKAYTQLRNEFQKSNAEMGKMIRRYRAAQDSVARAKVIGELAKQDQKRLDLRDSLAQTYPYLSKITSLQTYLSFHNHGQRYANEIDYFLNEYFRFADWEDPDYDYMTWVYESVKSYTTTISAFGLPQSRHQRSLEKLLAKMPASGRTKQLALSAIVAVLQEKSHPSFPFFAKAFVEEYKEIDPKAVAVIEQKMKQASTFMTGGEAPDFEMATPEGEMMKMSDLRGKVVLVDFWASWCGPCRRENPKVVKLYNKYKDKGFEILGVSLDSDKNRWLKAIADDKLTWPHVSDLRGWQNAAAKMYGVRSIPHTMLLDAEGKIIGRNYRGAVLEAKLEEIFGE